ncbi:MAG: hypothetical protein HON53_15230 [Planctomycetaceae bacterium]|nr:hypothetical protein [Planctomycetaceae bacterium]
MEALREEHVSLLATLQAMCRLFDEAEDTPEWWQAIESDFEGFLCRCEAHESSENELVQEAWLQDIGACD